jgi:hypothetical protein
MSTGSAATRTRTARSSRCFGRASSATPAPRRSSRSAQGASRTGSSGMRQRASRAGFVHAGSAPAIASRSASATRSIGYGRCSARSWPGRSRCRSTRASPTANPHTWSRTRAARSCSRAVKRSPTAPPRLRRHVEAGRRRDLLHEWHDRLPEGRHAHARERAGKHRDRDSRRRDRPSARTRVPDARRRAAVPRHRMSQSGSPGAADRRRRRDRRRVRRHAHDRDDRARAHHLVHCGPAIYHYVLHHASFSSDRVAAVRWASYGGAPIAPALVHQIQEQFPNARVGNGFGLTRVHLDRHVPPARLGGRARRVRWVCGTPRGGRRRRGSASPTR